MVEAGRKRRLGFFIILLYNLFVTCRGKAGLL